MSRFNFPNGRGMTLAGRLELPAEPTRDVVIFAHCFSCSKNVLVAAQVSRKLADKGMAVLRFDFTGLGNSDGDFANTNFSSNVSDLVAAASALRERDLTPSLLVGHSLGGAAALIAAGELSDIKAVATIAAPSEPSHVSHLFGDAVTRIEQDGVAVVRVGSQELRIEKQFLDDIHEHRLSRVLPNLRKPVLLFHSPTDEIVSIDNAREIHDRVRHPKSFVSLDGADHMLTRPSDAAFVANILATWAARHIPTERTSEG